MKILKIYNNNIYYLINKYLNKYNNATTFLSCKINCKMTMPHKLVWMNESSCKLHFYVIAFITWCHVFFLQLEFYVICPKGLGIVTSHM